MKNLGFLLLIFFASGCVMQKKYDELLAEKLKLESKLQECDDKLLTTYSSRDSLQSITTQLNKDTARLGKNIRSTSKLLNELRSEHEQLNTHYNNLLNNSGKLSSDLAEQQKSLLVIKDNLEKTRKLNEQLNADLEKREKKVLELEEIIAKEARAARSLKDKITNALLNFKGSDLTIEMKNGKVYVSLAEKLLFKSGSIVVDSKGVTALQQLAKAIKNQNNIEIMVEGHTDNVPISGNQKYLQDNWDLSVLRATSIVRILTKSGVTQNQVVAAGKGEFSPITNNETTEDKQKNRRTEIIIAPNLDQLFSILNK
ncbi:MAG: OmpA family protein [Cyclobacteriaceae bacterium]|nr:OmpA family protein [Cyclobacteriaceae bacterium]